MVTCKHHTELFGSVYWSLHVVYKIEISFCHRLLDSFNIVMKYDRGISDVCNFYTYNDFLCPKPLQYLYISIWLLCRRPFVSIDSSYSSYTTNYLKEWPMEMMANPHVIHIISVGRYDGNIQSLSLIIVFWIFDIKQIENIFPCYFPKLYFSKRSFIQTKDIAYRKKNSVKFPQKKSHDFNYL